MNEAEKSQNTELNQQYHFQKMQQHQIQQHNLQQQQMAQMSRDDSFIKLKRLDLINASMIQIINSLSTFFEDLSKEKHPPTKFKVTKQMFEDFLKLLKKFEGDLLTEITNLSLASTGHPHEGSVYGARKDYDLARMRLNLVCSQLNSLKESLNAPLKPLEEDDDEDDEDIQNERRDYYEQQQQMTADLVVNGNH